MTCVLMIILLMVCSVLQQSDSAFSSELTNGSDFYMGFLKNFDRKGQVKLEIVVSTSSPTPVAFRVHSAARNQLLGSGIVPALSELEVTIPLEYMLRTSRHAERHKGIHVVTNDSEVSIVAIASNRITSFTGSTSAYRIFPYQEVAGTAQYEYFAISIGAVSGQGLLSEFLLVGNENDTTITIFPTNETGSIHLPRDAQDGDAMIEVFPGEGYSITLHQLQTLLITKTVDLTGTRIVSNKPITVLSGHECGNVPHDVPKCDHVGVHVRPTSDWGKNFLLIPFLGRPSGQWIKIVTAEVNTLISRTCSGSLSSEMLFPSPGDSYFFKTTPFMSCYVQSNKPLLVAQLSQGGTLDGIGDPAMLLISPIEQYVNRVSLLALNADLFSHSYITITTSGDHFGPANVLLDGMPVIGDWNIVISQQSYIIGYGCRLQVSPGHHTVEHTNDDGRLSVVVYGFDNELRHAYGYSGSVSSRTDRPAFKPILLPGADTPTPTSSSTTAMHSSTLHPVLSTDLTTSIISTSLSLSTSSSVPLSSTMVVIEPALSSSYSLFTEYLTETDILLPSATIMLESAGFLNESTTPLLLAIAALTAVLAATTMALFVVLHQKAGKSSPPSSNTNGSTVNNTVINMPADSASEEQAAATLAGSDTEEDPQQTGNNADSTERHEPATDSASSAVENGLQQNEATSNDLQERENNSQRSENDSRRSGTSDNEEDSDQEDSDEENEEEAEESDGGEGDVDSCLAMKRALMASPPPTPLRSREPTPAEDGENEEDEENGEEDAEDGEQEEGDKDVEEEEEGAESEEQEDDSEQEEEDKDSEVEEGVGNDEETQTVELQEDDDHSEAADGEEMLSDKDEHGDTKSEDNSKDSDPKEAAATSAYPPSRGQPVDSGRCTCSDCQSQYYGTSYRQYPHQPYMYQNQYFNPYSTQSRLQPPPSRRQYSDWYSYY